MLRLSALGDVCNLVPTIRALQRRWPDIRITWIIGKAEHSLLAGLSGVEFVVYDAKTNDDITRSVLTQIIVEEESKGQNLLPIGFLRQLIGFYGDNLQWMVPRYLEQSMEAFAHNQDRIRAYFQETMSGMFPFNALGEMGKQNVAMFEQAMKMFTPFPGQEPKGNGATREEAKKPEPAPSPADQLRLLQEQLDRLQQHIASMGKPPAGKPNE